MDFLKFVAFLALLSSSSPLRSGEGAHDHERLTTVEGRVYHAILVIDADAAGLTFRHRDGVAKLPYSSLPTAYRMLYEAVDDLPAGDSEEPPADVHPDSGIEETEFAMESAVLAARSRIRLPAPSACFLLGGGGALPPPSPWPAWWPGHAQVHRLADPWHRERAVREFLHLSGLLPAPCFR